MTRDESPHVSRRTTPGAPLAVRQEPIAKNPSASWLFRRGERRRGGGVRRSMPDHLVSISFSRVTCVMYECALGCARSGSRPITAAGQASPARWTPPLPIPSWGVCGVCSRSTSYARMEASRQAPCQCSPSQPMAAFPVRYAHPSSPPSHHTPHHYHPIPHQQKSPRDLLLLLFFLAATTLCSTSHQTCEGGPASLFGRISTTRQRRRLARPIKYVLRTRFPGRISIQSMSQPSSYASPPEQGSTNDQSCACYNEVYVHTFMDKQWWRGAGCWANPSASSSAVTQVMLGVAPTRPRLGFVWPGPRKNRVQRFCFPPVSDTLSASLSYFFFLP